MDKKKELFTDPRWHDLPKPKVVGRVEVTEEQKERVKKAMKEHPEFFGLEKEDKEK